MSSSDKPSSNEVTEVSLDELIARMPVVVPSKDLSDLAFNGLRVTNEDSLPKKVNRFVRCGLALVNFNENNSFDALPTIFSEVKATGLNALAFGGDASVWGKGLPQAGDLNFKDIVCADLVTICYTYAMQQMLPADWKGDDPNRVFTGHHAANFWRPASSNADYLTQLSEKAASLPHDGDYQPGDVFVYGNGTIASHVNAYVGVVEWVQKDGTAQELGASVVNASINYMEGDTEKGGDIRRYDLASALTARNYGWSWVQHVRINELQGSKTSSDSDTASATSDTNTASIVSETNTASDSNPTPQQQ